MWTNVFKIGGLKHISWFQFLPNESDLNSLPDKSVKVEQKDVATCLVVLAHLQLQKEGFLSTWTNSFVGPWDPSQGLHNPDEKIKLWLFLPGRYSSVVDKAQAAVSRLRVVASGIWVAPGDSEEVAAALSQSLRNYIERALAGYSYMRFGDVFLKYHPSQSEGLSSKGQPTVEFIFSASEETIFVHVIISAKHIRALSNGDVERVLKHSSTNSSYRLPVIASPHGIRGSLTGCCPSDLVKQVYLSSGKFRTLNGYIGLPYHVSQGPGCQLRGQNCYVEITLGCPRSDSDKALQTNSQSTKNSSKNYIAESIAARRGDQKVSPDHLSAHEKAFIYPAEAVVVPVLQKSFARSSLKRFWLQNWIGPSLPGSSFFMHCGGDTDFLEGSWIESNGVRMQHGYNSSSNSNSSSISSISSGSSDTDYKMTTGELEADADSLSCRQSGLSSNDQMENDGLKLGSKRPRTGMTEPFGQAGMVKNVHMQDFGSVEVNDSAITGIANEQIGSRWDWDDDRGAGMDIQALLSEFGDFGDFFENDDLPFGEPPGTAESQALMFPGPDCGEVANSPIGAMDVVDQMLPPVAFPSFESFNPSPAVVIDESASKSQEQTPGTLALIPVSCTPSSSSGEFDHLIKAEALMTFAPEYGAVETLSSEFSSSIFRSPYCPKSRQVESSNSSSNNYAYGATPPSSPCFEGSNEKTGIQVNLKTGPGRNDTKKYYTLVDGGKVPLDRRTFTSNESRPTSEAMMPSPLLNSNSSNTVKSAQRKMSDGTLGAESFLFSMKTVLATEVECIMFQASMCRMRHTLLSPGNPTSVNLHRLSGSTGLNQVHGDASTMTDNISGRHEVKKKESIPVRIAGDMDGGVLDGHLNSPVGVWRSVGVPKLTKHTSSSNIEVSVSLPHHSFSEEGVLSYRQRQQPLQELLDGMALLVQQATSFVDVALDADCGDGPYGWLALQEHWRRGFSCGPSMIHAGCGGTLASCHFLDIAGVELVDPLSADIHSSAVTTLLQSEIKIALKSAFGNLEGPLCVTDWCKGHIQSGDGATTCDGSSGESTLSECKDSSTVTLSVGEPMSPALSSAAGSSSLKASSTPDGAKVDETSQRKSNQEIEPELVPRIKPTVFVLPLPAILVGYQDDWLKTSASSLQLWEKAPFEPYASPKPITYCVVCPDIDPLTSAAADFFQQLGTVYETCKLGTHSPQSLGNQMEMDAGKSLSSGFVLLDCPQSMKIESSNASLVGSISDYFLSLSNGWDLASYLKSLSKAVKALKIGPSLSTNPKEGNSSPCMVIYVVCPFPEPAAVLQTVIESSVSIGSIIPPANRERRSMLLAQVGKALSSLAAVDEASASNVLVLSGFSIPKLVLQIVTVDAIFRVTSPALNELIILKETAFTVYNKARRISKGSSNDVQPSTSSRSHLTQMSSVPAMWNSLPRETDIDSRLRSGTWDNSWQTARAGGLTCDPNRNGDFSLQDEIRYMFEPLFILSEPGSLDHAVAPTIIGNMVSESSKLQSDDTGGSFMQSASSAGSVDSGSSSQHDGSEPDGYGSSYQKTLPSLHCCYGWTEDWRWLVCIWTDARGELLDSHIFPFGGISSRQDTKGLQCLFVQVLQQGCQILQACSSPDTGGVKPRDFVITRIGNFFELEYIEWQKAIYSVGGSEVKKWPLQLRRSMPDGTAASANGASLQQQEMGLIQERTLPSSPSPLYSPHSKASGYMKGGLGQTSSRKQLMGGHAAVDNSRGMLQWMQSISFVTISIDHSLHLLLQADTPSSGGSGSGVGTSIYLEGITPVKSLGSTSASYILIPSPSMRFLPSTPLQHPTCLTAESPPLAHLLHSKGSAIPLSTGFVVSKAVPSVRRDYKSNSREEWPSVLSVSLIDYYGGNNMTQDKMFRRIVKQGGRTLGVDGKDFEIRTQVILESVAAELQALSWMTVSPAYLERRTALPFHCDMVLRLRRLLHFADKELSSQPGRSQV
ncbi:mediator of RNA polymerase II transcription subunit 13-like [Populus alba x Populus x berolinensis]|nr:mediator of RNA polymerase II transcription subunit 13-like [Populus alba x Populus x berolinensis]